MITSRMRRRVAVVREVLASQPRSLQVGLVVGNIIATISSALLPLMVKWTIDGATRGDTSLLFTGALGAALLTAGDDGAGRAAKDLRIYFSQAGGHFMSRRLLSVVARLPGLEHLERPEHHNQLKLVHGFTPGILTSSGGSAVASTIPQLLGAVRTAVTIVTSIVLLASVDLRLATLPLFVLPSIVLVNRVHAIERQAREDAAELERSVEHLQRVFADTDAAMELRVFGATDAIDLEADRRWREAVRIRTVGQFRAVALSAVGFSSIALGYIGALSLIAWNAGADPTTAGSLLMVSQIAARLRWQLQDAIGLGQQIKSVIEILDRVLWLDDYRPEGFRTPTADPPERLDDGIRFDQVTFRYPGTETDVLHDIDLTIAAGSTLAIVGDNGAGKTTLVKLLCGFYTPTHGRILVDDTPLADIDPHRWQTAITAAFQDFARIEDRFRRSVIPGTNADDATTRSVAERGDALTMTEGWPNGFDTHLGRTYTHGEQLSGGQWQRVAVARAMRREDPLVLVLDEPTAALDPAAEHRLYERYANASAESATARGGVTVLISHRFSTVRMADHIIVLDDGRILEEGDHDELLASGGRYAEMFTQQANAYA